MTWNADSFSVRFDDLSSFLDVLDDSVVAPFMDSVPQKCQNRDFSLVGLQVRPL
jgi:hypothetical protein